MDFYRWSALWRGIDLSLRYNQAILVLSVIGAAVGFVIGGDSFRPRITQAVVAGATVFVAAALAKELDPDRQQAAPLAAAAAVPFAGVAQLLGLVALLWLLGSVRFINRTSGARPKPTDTLALLAAAAWLSWRGSPIFGALLGIVLLLDALLPEGGSRLYAAVGVVALVASSVWLLNGAPAVAPEIWLAALLLLVAIVFIPIILTSYRLTTVDDDGGPLNASRVQAGQAVALSGGLFLASWLGGAGVILLIGLWAALLGVLIDQLVLMRLRRSVAPL